MLTQIKCNYCGENAQLVTGKVIYPHLMFLHENWYYLCDPCNAYVGTNKNCPNHTPHGSLANPQLRKARQKAHLAFDKIWKSGKTSRGHAYKILKSKLGLSNNNCHIGMFDVNLCNEVIRACDSNFFEDK